MYAHICEADRNGPTTKGSNESKNKSGLRYRVYYMLRTKAASQVAAGFSLALFIIVTVYERRKFVEDFRQSSRVRFTRICIDTRKTGRII